MSIKMILFNEKKGTTTVLLDSGEKGIARKHPIDDFSDRIGFLEAYFRATCGMRVKEARKFLRELETNPVAKFIQSLPDPKTKFIPSSDVNFFDYTKLINIMHSNNLLKTQWKKWIKRHGTVVTRTEGRFFCTASGFYLDEDSIILSCLTSTEPRRLSEIPFYFDYRYYKKFLLPLGASSDEVNVLDPIDHDKILGLSKEVFHVPSNGASGFKSKSYYIEFSSKMANCFTPVKPALLTVQDFDCLYLNTLAASKSLSPERWRAETRDIEEMVLTQSQLLSLHGAQFARKGSLLSTIDSSGEEIFITKFGDLARFLSIMPIPQAPKGVTVPTRTPKGPLSQIKSNPHLDIKSVSDNANPNFVKKYLPKQGGGDINGNAIYPSPPPLDSVEQTVSKKDLESHPSRQSKK